MTTRRNIALIAAADIMSCFIGILFLFISTATRELENKKQSIEAEIASLQSIKEQLQAEINNLRSEKWKVIASKWRLSDYESKVEIHKRLYILKDGIYTDPQSSPLSDDEIKTYLESNHNQGTNLALYVQNGANDNLLRSESLRASVGFKEYFLYILPSELNPKL